MPEAQENILLLILLPVFASGSFIALLYLPYSLPIGYLSARVYLTMYLEAPVQTSILQRADNEFH